MVEKSILSRRSFIECTGATIPAIGVLGAVNGPSNSIEVVTAVKADNEPVETETVTQDWYDYEQHVDRVLARFDDQNKDNPEIQNTALRRSEKTIDGLHTSEIEVFVSGQEKVGTSSAPPTVSQINLMMFLSNSHQLGTRLKLRTLDVTTAASMDLLSQVQYKWGTAVE